MMSVLEILFRNISHTFSFSSVDKTAFLRLPISKSRIKFFVTTDNVDYSNNLCYDHLSCLIPMVLYKAKELCWVTGTIAIDKA